MAVRTVIPREWSQISDATILTCSAVCGMRRMLKVPRFARLIGVYTAANIANAAIPFLLLPILTRALTPADYGIVAMFGITVSVMFAFTGLNVHGSVGVRWFQLEADDMRRYLAGCLVILAGSSLFVLLTILLFRDQIEAVTDVPGPWLTVAALTSVAQFLILLRLILWQVRQQAWRYAGLQFAQSLLNALLSLVLVIAAGWAWEGRVAAQAIVAGAFGVLALALLVRARAFLWPARREDVRSALAFGVPLIPHVIGALLISALDRLMISNMLDVAQAGIYTVALQIGMVLGLLTESFNRAYAPWLTEALAANDRARDIRIVRGTYSYFVCVSAIAILVGLAAPPLLDVLVGAQFRAAAPAVIYIAMGYAFGGMYYMVTNYVFYAGYTGRLAWLTLGSGVFNAAATYVLIRENGAVGAAQAFMLSQAALFFGTWALAHRARPMPWRQALVRSQAACSSSTM